MPLSNSLTHLRFGTFTNIHDPRKLSRNKHVSHPELELDLAYSQPAISSQYPHPSSSHRRPNSLYTCEAYMENRPFKAPGFDPGRGRGAFKPAFQPYPAPWGRGRQDVWQAPRGRGRGFVAGPGGLPSRNLNVPVTNVASAPSQPRQIRINDITFELDAKGSKLTRITRQSLTEYDKEGAIADDEQPSTKVQKHQLNIRSRASSSTERRTAISIARIATWRCSTRSLFITLHPAQFLRQFMSAPPRINALHCNTS